MGSILSFPILCLANLGVYLLTTDHMQRGWSTEQRLNHVLINGDDMVYAAPRSLWERQIEVGKAVGLEMSVGKAYVHPVYSNINSTSVHLDLRLLKERSFEQNRCDWEGENFIRDLAREPSPWQINYLNTGLFFGQHKVQERSEARTITGVQTVAEGCSLEITSEDLLKATYGNQLGHKLAAAHLGQDPTRGLVPNLNCVLAGSLPGRAVQLLKRFLVTNQEDIQKECTAAVIHGGKTHLFTRNLFLPLSVGGMGVLPPVGWKFKITPQDRHIAHGIYQGYLGGSTTSQRPLPGWEVEDADDLVDAAFLKPATDIESIPMKGHSHTKSSMKRLVVGIIRYSSTSKCYWIKPDTLRNKFHIGALELYQRFVTACEQDIGLEGEGFGHPS